MVSQGIDMVSFGCGSWDCRHLNSGVYIINVEFGSSSNSMG